MYYTDIKELKGKTISDVVVHDDEIIFYLSNGEKYKMYHEQDCCESVTIEDIVGDINDLIGNTLLVAEVVTSNDYFDTLQPHEKTWEYLKGYKPTTGESETWTFYKFATIKGSVSIRWYGESNGYYSEEVTIRKIS